MGEIQLAMTTDYLKSDGDPRPEIRMIAEAGFSHIHWGHEWDSDRFYLDSEIYDINQSLKETHLKTYAIHGSTGKHCCWYSAQEEERLAGVELVKNRIRLAGGLACDTVVMHISIGPHQDEKYEVFLSQLHRSLDALQTYAKIYEVQIAIENEIDWEKLKQDLTSNMSIFPDLASTKPVYGDNFGLIANILNDYDPEYLGFCYDSGHGNIGLDRLDRAAPLMGRLIALHLHDNDGAWDQHKLPYNGTVNWPVLTQMIADSPYHKPLCIESMQVNSGIKIEKEFLEKAFSIGSNLTEKIKCLEQSSVC